MTRLIDERDGEYISFDVELFEDPDALSAIKPGLRWDVLRELARRPQYPAAIADALDEPDQKVYYHIDQLRDAGVIEVASREERSGSIAKYYRPVADAFALRLPGAEGQLAEQAFEQRQPHLRRLLRPFVANGRIECSIVVGSPEPHGPHQVRGKDGHYALDLAAAIGRLGEQQDDIAALDVDIKNENRMGENMILVGGPLTNVVTAEFNQYFPVHFDQETFPYRRLVSEQTGEEYDDDAIGVIAKTRNPEDPDSAVLMVAGVRNTGTLSAIKAFRSPERIFEDYEGEDTWARVVRGRDMDGDGRIDDVQLVE